MEYYIECELAGLISIGLNRQTLKFAKTIETLNNFHQRPEYNFQHIKRELTIETENAVGADFTLKAPTSGKDYKVGYKIEKSIKKNNRDFQLSV